VGWPDHLFRRRLRRSGSRRDVPCASVGVPVPCAGPRLCSADRRQGSQTADGGPCGPLDDVARRWFWCWVGGGYTGGSKRDQERNHPGDQLRHSAIVPSGSDKLETARCHDVVTSRGKHCGDTGGYARTCAEVFALITSGFHRCNEYPRRYAEPSCKRAVVSSILTGGLSVRSACRCWSIRLRPPARQSCWPALGAIWTLGVDDVDVAHARNVCRGTAIGTSPGRSLRDCTRSRIVVVRTVERRHFACITVA
jgi:hypothetical protein